MNPITLTIHSPLVHALGWTLVHFLWQGACIATAYALLRYTLRNRSPATRYHLAMLTLAVMAVMPVVTLVHLLNAAPPDIQKQSVVPLSAVTVVLHPELVQYTGPHVTILGVARIVMQRLVPWVVPLWLLGVMVMSLRVWRGWEQARFLRRTAVFSPLPAWKTAVDRLQNILGIHKAVRLAVSAGITVPSVIGWLKPIILIPPGVLTGLTPLQMELILAHELAHIRRQDYLWNLLQVFVDTLLFYHPAVRWVSHHARMEREQCCDDIVVNMNGDAINYARALTELERLRTPRNAMVLGADGGQIIHRIHRLIGMPAADISPFSWALPLMAVSLLVTGSLARIPFRNPVFESHTPPSTATDTVGRQPQNRRTLALQATHVPVTGARMIALRPIQDIARFEAMPLSDSLPALTPVTHQQPYTETESTSVRRSGGDVIQRNRPQYPQYALERGISGSATVAFTLKANGDIADIRIIQVRGSRLFGQSAVDALKHWKFTPVLLNGKAVDQAMTQEFDFHLDAPDTKAGTCRIPIGFHICARN